jgi:hypothetical protein
VTDTVDKVIIQSETQGVQQSTDQLNQLGKSMDGVTVAATNVEKSTGSVDSKFASLERRFSTTAGQAAQLERVQRSVNVAVAQNPGLQDRANAVLAAAEARYTAAGASVKELASAHKGLDSQGQAALHSVRSVVEQLALGIPPTQALTGQINHLTYAASGEGGLAGAFKQVGGFIGGLVTPATVSIAAVAALGVAAAAAAVQFDRMQVSSQRAVSGAGARSGTSVSDLNQFTSQNSSAFGLSSKEARGFAEDLTQTGEIVVSRLHGMSDAVVGFANQTGKSIEEARKEFIGFAVDPQKGLQELSKTYGDFDVSTRKAVDALSLAGDKTGALQVIVDSLSDKSKRAADNMGFLEKAARGVVNVLATEASKPVGLEGQLAAVQQRLASDGNGAALSAGTVAKLRQEAEDLQKALDKVNAQKAAAEINKLSTAADAADKAIIPQIAQIEQLKAKLQELERAKAGGAPSKYGAGVDESAALAIQNQIAALQEAQGQAARYNQQVAIISQSWGNVGQSVALTLQAMQNQLPVVQAVTAAAQMRAQSEATYNSLLDQGKTAIEAQAIASKQLETSQAAATAGVKKQIEALGDATDMIKAQANGTEAATAAAIAFKNAMEAGASATAAAALSAATLANYVAKAAAAEQQRINSDIRQQTEQQSSAILDSRGNVVGIKNAWGSDWEGTGGTSSWDPGGFFGNLKPDTTAGTSKGISDAVNAAIANGGVDAAITALKKTKGYGGNIGGPILPDIAATPIDYNALFSQADALYGLKNAQTTDKSVQVANLKDEMAFIQSTPESVARDQKIVDLISAINSLTNSTDGLNSTNQDLLSPYYSQDPRTSHIGFRSQGMATGGELTVPGGYSANDNMLAQIPVASGEIVSVRRPGQNLSGGSSQNVTINLGGITVNTGGAADTNAIGRTVYQAMQSASRQLATAGR